MIIILILLTIFCLLINIYIPYFSIGGRELLASSFFLSGYASKDYTPLRGRIVIPIGGVVLILMAYLMPMGMLSLTVQGILPYFLSALCGIALVWILSKKLSEISFWGKSILLFIGDNTLQILTWHFLSFKLVSLLIIWVENRPIQQLACFPVIPESFEGHYYTPWWPFYFICGIFVPLLIVLLSNKINCKQSF